MMQFPKSCLVFTVVLLIVPILGSACSPQPIRQPFVQRWLRKDPCASPCWEGITLGTTTQEDAIHILKEDINVFITDDGGLTSTLDPKSARTIRWDWTDQLDRLRFVPGVFTENQIDVRPGLKTYVREMRMNFPYGFTLQQMVDAYGYPTHVVVVTSEPIAGIGIDPASLPDRNRTMHLVYLNQGFSIAISVIPKAKAHKLTPSDDLDNVLAFWPADSGGFRESGYNPEELISWAGLESFEYYCTKSTTIPVGLC